jgi:hypothetical protein
VTDRSYTAGLAAFGMHAKPTAHISRVNGMAEAKAPVRPFDRQSDAESETDELVLGQEELDSLLAVGIPLPDGRLIPIDALMAAIAAGDATVPATDGEEISILVALDLLEKSFMKAGGETDGDPTEEENQASFREEMGLVMLGSLFENGRISSSEEASRPLGVTRRGKEKTVDKDQELRDILVDGPGANDDIIQPTGNGSQEGEFIERIRVEGDKASFEATKGTGFLLANDEAGTNGYGEIVSVEYNGTIYKASGGQIVVDEPGAWRLTITLAGEPGKPETGYGLYYFEQYGAYNHSQSLDGNVQVFSMIYTVADQNGQEDSATIKFKIADSNPDAVDDVILALQDYVSYGNVTKNDDVGGDLPGGILEIGNRHTSMSVEDADAHGRVTLEGAYGSLIFDLDDGSYEYHSKANVIPDGTYVVFDEFYYRLADSDGDSDLAKLQITIVPGDTLPTISNPGGEGEGTKPRTFFWTAVTEIDANKDGTVDDVRTIAGFKPADDRLNIDGLLAELGHDVLDHADDVFRLIDSNNTVLLQVDLGIGWQTFAVIINKPAITSDEVEAAIVA